MAEMTNAMKEVDMKIVMRRLEARKRDLNQDGALSKKQLAAAYRGYHGLEMQYHALLKMSNSRMIGVKTANDHLSSKYEDNLKHILSQEKAREEIIDRDLKAMRNDFTSQLAYQYVYKNYSLRQKEKGFQKPRPYSDRPDLYEEERKKSALTTGPRPLGSLRQMETYKDELKLKFPPIKDPKHENVSAQESPRVNAFGERTYEDLKKQQDNTETKKEVSTHMKDSFPNIEGALGVEIRYRHKIIDDEKSSLISAPAGMLKDTEHDRENVHIEYFNMGQNLILLRKMAQERVEKSRMLPAPPPSRSDARKESWRRLLPPTPSRPTTVFPNNTKNSSDVKKLMRREATNVMDNWAHENKRKEAVEKIKEIENAKKQISTFPTFDKSRPTSAILREFVEYKKAQEEEKMLREQRLADQPLFVRQMSPQPRLTTPHLQRRSEYSQHVHSKAPSREGSLISKDVPIRRTESEKIPSVSRTGSLSNLPDGLIELHENALLTAAERIEIEKQKRELEKDIEEYNKTVEVSNKKTGRKLPQPPADLRKLPQPPEDSKKLSQSTGDSRKLPQPPRDSTVKPNRKRSRERKMPISKMFDTSVLAINRVTQANQQAGMEPKRPSTSTTTSAIHDTHDGDKHSSSTPMERRLLEKIHPTNINLDHYDHKIDQANLEFITTATGKTLFPQRVQRDYDHYSRVSPEMKRHLELRAKIKKKVKQKNAQLAAEKKAKTKMSDGISVTDSERGTQVSFNENVVVFQTI